MPEMIVSPDSGSRCTRNVGSSFWNRLSALEKLVLESLTLGWIASEMTGSGTYMDVIEYSSLPSVNVSPEEQSTPNIAPISPDLISFTSSISFACRRTRRGTLIFLLFLTLKIVSPRVIVPWYTRMYVSWPKRPSSNLNARPTNGALPSGESTTGLSLSCTSSATFSTCVGSGRYAVTPSSSVCTPLFLIAEPSITGANLSAIVARRIAACMSATVGVCSFKYMSAKTSSTSASRSNSSARLASASAAYACGTSMILLLSPLEPSNTCAFIAMTSTMPSNWFSRPIGIWIAAALRCSLARIWSMTFHGLAPARSSLLMKQMRGTL
eukprot:Unigene3345_Nuclearia_a/m.10272 Unigene3345_Nuclearia_a/g.10272  ORF Unigene3345_Nuclearia_a/g.10272 Unigene3345_Nuclearia_a/m.10272 type:complete len:325 (-) Unigene3345_Nuclearia_a:120-1094(-)